MSPLANSFTHSSICMHSTIFLFHAKPEMWTTFDFAFLCGTTLTHSLCTKATRRCFDSIILVSIEFNFCSSKPYDAYLILKRNEIICTNMTTTPTKTAADGTEEFDWIQLSMDLQDPGKEEFVDKFWRKVKSNPFVPIGMLYFCPLFFPCGTFHDSPQIPGAFGATGALIYGLYSMKNNDSRMSQLMVGIVDWLSSFLSMDNINWSIFYPQMRTRIGAQAFAIVALVTGLILANPLPPKNK